MQSHPTDGTTDGDDFGSVAWETAPSPAAPSGGLGASHDDLQDLTQYHSLDRDHVPNPSSVVASSSQQDPHPSLANTPVHSVQVKEGKVELEGTSETFVSYLVTAKVSLSRCGGRAVSLS